MIANHPEATSANGVWWSITSTTIGNKDADQGRLAAILDE
jgi:hypothetical protein